MILQEAVVSSEIWHTKTVLCREQNDWKADLSKNLPKSGIEERSVCAMTICAAIKMLITRKIVREVQKFACFGLISTTQWLKQNIIRIFGWWRSKFCGVKHSKIRFGIPDVCCACYFFPSDMNPRLRTGELSRCKRCFFKGKRLTGVRLKTNQK